MKLILLICCFCVLSFINITQAQINPRFKAIALYENSGHHIEYSKVAKVWLDKLAIDSNFSIDYIQNTDSIDDNFLSKYNLFIQLDFPPYGWKDKAAQAFQRYITEGKGGWIGFHHAALLGEFDGYPMWQWFSAFMGNVIYKNYIPTFVTATVNVEDSSFPVMHGIASSFIIDKEEWYIYNRSPRTSVHVIASVDENSYSPDSGIKMGDHPVIWTNTNFNARNIYIFLGHSPELFKNAAYTTIFRNSIFWAAAKN
jgi:type 1 glutamine amidotransferase